MTAYTHGIHHITAFAGDPQTNVDFYTGVLGLRLVKKTVNFDDPHTYHFYFGTETGAPGTILTFFPWTDKGRRGRPGIGQVGVTAFAIPQNALNYWADRLKAHRVETAGSRTRFNERALGFRDPDGLEIELVAGAEDPRDPWPNGPIPAEHAIRGFHSAALFLDNTGPTARLLTETLGFRAVETSGVRARYSADGGRPGDILDLIHRPNGAIGQMGVGVVHHIAFRTPDETVQLALREALTGQSYHVSPVMDRCYFRSIYFREPGRVLFEVATDPPGFGIDETPDRLGRRLQLPPWLEPERATLEATLPPITPPAAGGA